MCNFLSALVTRQGEVKYNLYTDSHEDLIELYGLRDNSMMGQFVRVEYRPKNSNDLADVTKYKLYVDEEETPEWFEDYRQKVEKKLKHIIKHNNCQRKQKHSCGWSLHTIPKSQG